jgi:ABC-type nitrate/sulfonate/bicarbonate transport system permease component
MQKSSPSRVTGRDVAGAGFFLLSANLLFAAIGAGIGAIFGGALAGGVIGFLIGFVVGVYVVTRRFRNY